MPRNGGNSQDRRRQRRAAYRRVQGARSDEHYDFDELVAAATALSDDDVEEPTVAPELAALEAFDAAFQATVLCSCGHSYSEHAGAMGACAHTDGRGSCSCAEFAEALVEAWSGAEGFTDVLADLNALLADSAPGLRAVDVSVKLDKTIVCDVEDESLWTAPMVIADSGAVGLSLREQWAPLDESSRAAGTSAAQLQFALRDIVLTADGATAPPMPDEHKPSERMPRGGKKIQPVQEPTPPAGASSDGVAWEATFVPEGVLTDDGRAFAPGSLTWRELPLTLMAMINTSAEGGHDGALVSGRIDNMWREGNLIKASGMFDGGEYGADIARMVGDGTLRGLSVDIAIHEAEVGPRSDYFSEDGTWREDAPVGRDEEQTVADMLFGGEDDSPPVFVVTKGVIGMATVCPFPAFADASIALIASGAGLRYTHQAGWIAVRRTLTAAAAVADEATETDEPVEDAPEAESLTAAALGAAPLKPPAEWFANPDLEELTPLAITEDGRIYGHAWSWESCHISFPDACVTAPHTATENAYFHLGEIECEDGARLPVGKVTIDAPHAGQRLSRADATAHYDHTGTVAAHVVCGEDEFGGWVAGAICPDLPEETLRLLRGSALSGDWRNVNGNLELVALLAVNVPGFPVPRVLVASAAEGDGMEVLSLVAAGVVRERTDEDELADIAELVKQVAA